MKYNKQKFDAAFRRFARLVLCGAVTGALSLTATFAGYRTLGVVFLAACLVLAIAAVAMRPETHEYFEDGDPDTLCSGCLPGVNHIQGETGGVQG